NTYGSMYGLSRQQGVAHAGDYRIAMIGPTGKNFNYADSTEATGDSPQMFALARLFNRPALAAFEADRSHGDPSALDLFWYQSAEHSTLPAMEKDQLFRDAGVVTMRSAWDDPNATFVGFK